MNTLIKILFEQSKENTMNAPNCPDGIGLRAIMDFFSVVFSNSAPDLRARVKSCYKIHIEREQEEQTSKVKNDNSKKVKFWCFSAAFG